MNLELRIMKNCRWVFLVFCVECLSGLGYNGAEIGSEAQGRVMKNANTLRVEGMRSMEDRVQGRLDFGRVVVFGVVLVCAFSSASLGAPWLGSGDANDPYQIWTAEDMQAIGADANYWDAYFVLCADINLGSYTGTSFNIIGNDVNAFTGVFDGDGHTISNFTYDSNGVNYIGLFGAVGCWSEEKSGDIKDLVLVDPNVNAGSGGAIGSLVGRLVNGTISSCYIRGGGVSGYGGVGGLVGDNEGGEIADCYSQGEVSGVYRTVGGLVGWHSGTVWNSYAWGSVTGEYSVGGLVGMNKGMISNCYATGKVEGDGAIGGLVGTNASATVWNCYATASVEGEEATGGLVGVNECETVSNCYATGSVTGGISTGGLVGMNKGGTISKCYAAGSVVGTGPYAGGLVGYHYPGGSYMKSFWNSEIINPYIPGIGNWNDPNVIGETTANMQTESTFTDAGWDFVGEFINGPNDIWDICEGTNYPKLVWQIPAGDLVCPDGVDGIDVGVLCEEWLFEELSCDVWPEGGDGFVDFLDWVIFADGWGHAYDIFDLAEFAGQWLKSGSNYLVTDIAPGSDGDGITNGVDFAAMAENWLEGI
ncbi:MAG: hypothetical protein JSW23_00150 [Planctomycetota bacterium]|nr:MAG: hypothetical protein JSW23_00150 [Planctomycetota bacterium]